MKNYRITGFSHAARTGFARLSAAFFLVCSLGAEATAPRIAPELFGEERFYDAAETIWNFVDKYMINHDVGEWKTLLDRKGNPLDPNIGNPWKVCYHTGRAMVESVGLLNKIIARKK